MTGRRWMAVLLAATLGATAGCSWPPKMPSWPSLPSLPDFSLTGEGVDKGSEISCDAATRLNLKALDWSGAKEVDVHVKNGRFNPRRLVLTVNAPNILRVFNADDGVRVFRAKDFFNSAAVVAISYDGEALDHTCIEAIKVGPRKWAELRLVPLRQGEYGFGQEEPAGLYSGSLKAELPDGRIIVR